MTQKASILLAHGSRDPHWLEPFRALASSIHQRLQAQSDGNQPSPRMELAFMELAQPGLQDTVKRLAAQGITEITVLPLFFAAGQHLRRDVPAMLEQVKTELAEQGTHLDIELQGPVGLEAEVADAISHIVLRQLSR